MKRIALLLIVLSALVSICAVAADENVTDVVSQDDSLQQQTVEVDDGTLVKAVDDSNTLEADASAVSQTNKTASKITSSKVKGYQSFKTTISMKLTSNNKPLASKKVSILLNGVTYNRMTDKNGQATLSVKNLKPGTYKAKFTYSGDELTEAATGSCKVIINKAIKTKLKLGDKDIYYRQGSKCLFYVTLKTSEGKAIKNQIVRFIVGGKVHKAKTDKNGIAKTFLSLKKGKHGVRYSFYKTSPYLYSTGKHFIKVHAKMPKGNGYWLWPRHMYSIDLNSLAKKGTKHIFLHSEALYSYGKSAVVSFISKAHRHGIKVHLWMQICCVGENWVSPVRDDGSFKNGFIDGKVKLAKQYAKIKGVDGIHLDYIRFGGTAHKHKNAVNCINYIVKKVSTQIHKIKPNCIVSAAIMPEPSMMTYYYGQDIPTMSRYLDALLPMVYKGNYHQKRSWITSVTKTYVKQSSGAQVWTGLQSYHSDSNPSKLSQKTLVKDSRAAMKGGAKGVVLFRIGISCNFNFKKV